MNENATVEQGFYQQCAALLDCGEYAYTEWLDRTRTGYKRKTRWNNRAAGNGCFPGKGLVRMFAPNLIHISLHNPRMNGVYSSAEDALAAITAAVEGHNDFLHS